MNTRTLSVVTMTTFLALQVSSLALGFETVVPEAEITPMAVCAPALVMPTGHDNLVDINSAPADWLVSVGIDEALAARIIGNRPYQSTEDLLGKGILPRVIFDQIKDRIIARHA
jgi:DNA uptake protein ComE-like DNA-binding protein